MTPFFTDLARNLWMKPFGISEADVESVLAAPTHQEAIQLQGGSPIALLTGRSRSGMLLVRGRASGTVLTVEEVFKVPEGIASDQSVADAPLKVPQALAEQFGLDITIGAQRKKFFLSELIPIRPGQSAGKMVEVHNQKGANFSLSQMVRVVKGPDGKPAHVDCAICFAIDTASYRRAVGTK